MKNDMNPMRIFLVVSLVFCGVFSYFATGQVVYGENFGVNQDSTQLYGIPKWAIHGDNDLSWIKAEMTSNTELKRHAISILKRTDPYISALDTVFEMSSDEIGQISFLRDINHDGKPDSVILLPAPEPADSRKNHISYQFNWAFHAGDEVQILFSQTEKHTTWYYVRTPVSHRNNPERFPQAAFVYGWVLKSDVLEL